MTTPFHSKYYAHELTKRCSSDNLEKLSQSLNNATIDLNPHQIDAALFAFKSPLSRGALLADEVGLGKTIEAGLVISQLWAERKRRILCIMPAALRQQWERELSEKFFIDSVILESGNYRELLRQGHHNPFEHKNKVVLCSFQFARREADLIRRIPWDLVVIDEAHRLRNVYKPANKIARAIREAVNHRPKLLLTATPLQNSLMELYGLVSFIDPHLFGSDSSFKEQFTRTAADEGSDEYSSLRRRIQPICQRTLRRQVLEYVPFTNRVSLTQDFTPTNEEWKLYEEVSNYLQRPQAYALPAGQRNLITLVLRKILASSSFAIGATLGKLIERLENKENILKPAAADALPGLETEFESLPETREEWEEEDAEKADKEIPDAIDLTALHKEIEELKNFKTLAESIKRNEKGSALLTALKTGLERAGQLGARRKALIFTESRRTQAYLKELLQTSGYAGNIVTFNGTNEDPDSQKIYRDWLVRHEGQDCITGSPASDTRSALVEEFRDRATLMIATESAAEGINLQFCSLVVNYDLPWNPQRIEQRIGRCHRYGQDHDVVVINFVNRKNAADQRVFELLDKKFKLFDGIFGASDQVLGALESGVDFERRVNDIYQTCRTREEINASFDRLQKELDLQIESRLETVKTQLMEHFDSEVQERLRLKKSETRVQRNKYHMLLWWLTQSEIKEGAVFHSPDTLEFTLDKLPEGIHAHPGKYSLLPERAIDGIHHYRIGHALAEHFINTALARNLEPKQLVFNYDPQVRKIALVGNLQGKSGWLQLQLVQIDSLEPEDHLLFSGVFDDGSPMDSETCAKLFEVQAMEAGPATITADIAEKLKAQTEQTLKNILGVTGERNKTFFEDEIEKLETWAADLKDGLETELGVLQKEITSLKREALQAVDLAAKVDLRKKAAAVEHRRNEKRKTLFEAQEDIEKQKDTLLANVEAKLNIQQKQEELFAIRWEVPQKA